MAKKKDKTRVRKALVKKEKVEKKVKKEVKAEKKPSMTQAVIFGKNWKESDAVLWLKKNNLEPIGKVHKTKGDSLKYTIIDEKKLGKLGFKKTGKGISFIIGNLK